MDVDDCFTNVVGEFGRYQVLLCVLVSLYGVSFVWYFLIYHKVVKFIVLKLYWFEWFGDIKCLK